ncbi:MAG: hypothetical protein JNK72_14260 [Myxococcales bacterium]|nr:hypothetical protein [Myxococcales bacterium]
MQREIDAARPPTAVRIAVINAPGAEAGNASIVMGRTLPYCQDSSTANVTTSWGAAVRQLWLLDGQNRQVEVVDLTQFSLDQPANFAAVKARILRLAGAM